LYNIIIRIHSNVVIVFHNHNVFTLQRNNWAESAGYSISLRQFITGAGPNIPYHLLKVFVKLVIISCKLLIQ
jgi:hypothetical protein